MTTHEELIATFQEWREENAKSPAGFTKAITDGVLADVIDEIRDQAARFDGRRVSNPDVPVEATFKWLVKEKDRLRAKLDLLREYAHRLEDYCAKLAENEKRILADNARLAKANEQLAQASAGLTAKQRRRVLSWMKQALNLLEQGFVDQDIEEEEDLV